MAFERFIEELRGTGNEGDRVFADVAKAYRKQRGGDIPLKEKTGDIIRPSAEAKRALEKRYGKDRVVYVEVRPETLAQLEQRTGVKSYLYGKNAEAAANLLALNAQIAVILPDPILKATYGEPFSDQQRILSEARKPINGFTFTHPQTPVDAVSIGQSVFEQTGVNILSNYTRVGNDGSLVVGRLGPGVGVDVGGRFRPDKSDGDVGILSLAVPTKAFGR